MNQTHTKQQLLLFIMCGRQRRAMPPSLMAIVVVERRPLSPANGRRSDVCFVKTCIFLNGQRRLKITLFFSTQALMLSFVVVKLGENTGEKVGQHVKDWYCVCVAMKARNCGSRATDGRASERRLSGIRRRFVWT